MKVYLKVTFSPISQEASEVLMAQLAEIGFYAFEESEESLVGYIIKADYNEADFMSSLPEKTGFIVEELADRNWNQLWEADFKPVVVDDFVGIRAGFHPGLSGVLHEIVITPKMSFGTGHHATTEMMVRLMRGVDFRGKKVVDFGTGTGVLSILAAMRGASSVYAVDNDEWSIDNAVENIKNNNCKTIEVHLAADLAKAPASDIILANINLNVLLAHASEIGDKLLPSGIIILSGVLETDEEKLVSSFENEGFSTIRKINMGGWMALMMKK